MCECLLYFHEVGVYHGDISADKFLYRGRITKDINIRAYSPICVADCGNIKEAYRKIRGRITTNNM